MSFIIKSIVLYNIEGEKRVLSFKESGMNIITGSSGTGKTSIADVISYCLGGDFDVKGKIRDIIEWYALHLKLNNQEVFIARKKPPGSQANTNICHFLIGNKVEIPDFETLDGKDSIGSVTDFLSRSIGISLNILKPKAGSTLSPAEPHLKHALYYNFLKQSTIANEKVLFHRQDEQFVGNYIKLTAPYFIGAIPEDQISKKIELTELKRSLKQVELEIQEIQSVIGKGTSRGISLLKEAESLDMVDVVEEPKDLNELLVLLQSIELNKLESIEKLPLDTLVKLHAERDQLIEEYNNYRSELDIAQKFQGEQKSFTKESGEQVARLQSIQLFDVFSVNDVECPGCGREGINFSNVENEIKKSFAKLNSHIELVTNSKTKLGSYIEGLREKTSLLKESIRIVNSNIHTVNKQSAELTEKKNIEQQKAKVFGRISLYLESQETKKDISSLAGRRDALQKKVENLESELDYSTMEEVFEAQLSLISKDMSQWSKSLMKENAGLDYKINFSKLTVEAITDKGPIAMYKMGSGQNWLGCHLITYYALHKWFREKERPVPGFLFLDQPSQVWFPPETTMEQKKPNEDWKAVKGLFDWLLKVTEEIKGLQVILVDHVDFKDNEQFKEKTLETWRDGKALVPYEWIK